MIIEVLQSTLCFPPRLTEAGTDGQSHRSRKINIGSAAKEDQLVAPLAILSFEERKRNLLCPQQLNFNVARAFCLCSFFPPQFAVLEFWKLVAWN